MIIKGRLSLSHNKCEYTIFYNGRNINISDIIYSMYIDKSKVAVEIADMYSSKTLFSSEGELYKERIQPCFYSYFVGEVDLEQVLWDNVGKKLSIEIKNITRS
ncbi:hypothetical protein [Schnuerera sp.]|uniref:hypothetical protein n=1 Tax=Schnuerera sp. TaxID=2794844 RepID=UPI002C2A2034|nr:hypothetical protein [Schnuerera sp.]HSH36455.1 hypothetical protein [Schnuerera sp.]